MERPKGALVLQRTTTGRCQKSCEKKGKEKEKLGKNTKEDAKTPKT